MDPQSTLTSSPINHSAVGTLQQAGTYPSSKPQPRLNPVQTQPRRNLPP